MPKIVPTIANVAMAMMIAQPGEQAIEAATRRNGRVFALNIIALLLTAVVVVVCTWLTWDSGNKVQDAIRADANVRIEEARSEAAKAIDHSNSLALELAKQQTRAAEAERQLLELRQQVEPRHLTEAQRNKLVQLLSNVRKTGSCTIRWAPTVSDAPRYSSDF